MTTAPILGVSLRYSHTIGRSENAGTGFRQPVALARGKDDLIYVVSRSYDYRPEAKRVTILTVDEEYIGEFAQGVHAAGDTAIPTGDGVMVWPTSIACDSEGKVYIADEWLNRISIFSGDGEYLSKWGMPGSGDGEISQPSGLAFDQDDNLWVVDSGNNRLQKFTKDGQFLAKWGEAGSGDGQLNMPWGIEIDRQGNIFIADWRNDRIQKFAPDGQFLMKVGTSGNGDGQLNRPTGVGVSQEGYIYAADWGNERLQVFGPDGQFVTMSYGEAGISRWGQIKLDANPEMWQERDVAQGLERERQFWSPIAVEVDSEGRVFVLESARSRIQVFRQLAPAYVGSRL